MADVGLAQAGSCLFRALTVIETGRADRAGRRRNGKSDSLDAESPARAAEGMTKTEIMRCLKRHIAREVFPLLVACPRLAPGQPSAPHAAGVLA